MPNDAKTDQELLSFLKKRGLSGAKVLDGLAEFGVSSLYDLKAVKEDPTMLGLVKAKFQDQPIVVKALDALAVEAIDNAIYYSETSGAEARAQALAEFLATNDVPADVQSRDPLLSILRAGGVRSLEELKALKNRGVDDAKRKALTAALHRWNPEASSRFDAITAATVARALRSGDAAEATPELKAFLAKRGVPGGTEQELAGLGITTLEQLKAVKEDRAPGGGWAEVKDRLDNSGIRLATRQMDALRVDDIEQEIAEVNSPEVQDAKARTAQLTKAIDDVKALRAKVEGTSDTAFAAVKTEVADRHKSVLLTIKDVCGADFTSADAAALQSKKDLLALLSTTISNASSTKEILDGVDKTSRTVAKVIRQQDVLCGFSISPAETTRKHVELVKLPENPDDMTRDPGTSRSLTLKYQGSETKSFATSSARESSSTIATAAEASGGGFVGSGVAAVSAAASYADAQKASAESQKFRTATLAECGEIYYIYVPKRVIQFTKRDLRLSDDAAQRLATIAALAPEQQTDAVLSFYEEFGTHFFLHYSLGGRYELTSKGRQTSRTDKQLLIDAVADTTQWAAAASGSYAGMGGAASAAASVKGQTSVASAQGDRFAITFETAQVSVATEVLGGAALAPRDVWVQSLAYNSTWAVIDRDQPLGVWELVTLDTTLPAEVKALAPVLERVWVRSTFLDAVRRSNPVLHQYVERTPTIVTCRALNDAVEQHSGQPQLQVTVVRATSGPAEHPRVRAETDEEGLKLIGGGASVDYGNGAGNLLTGSYPDGNGWVASSKSHRISSPATVTAYAVYVSDPYDQWDVTRVPAKTSAPSGSPEATARLPEGYAITGGGALVDWGGVGIMLTSCCPAQGDDGSYTGWTAKGKAHLEGDSGNATAWVFGIRARSGSAPAPSKVIVTPPMQGNNHPELERTSTSSEQVIVGGGAAVTWRGPGGMLTCTAPTSATSAAQTWAAKAKDHQEYDGSLDFSMWVISRPGRFVTAEEG